MFAVGEIFKMFLKEVSYAQQGYIYLIKRRQNSNIVKYYYNLNDLWYILMYLNM